MSKTTLYCCEYPEDTMTIYPRGTGKVDIATVNIFDSLNDNTLFSLDLTGVNILIKELTSWKKDNNYD